MPEVKKTPGCFSIGNMASAPSENPKTGLQKAVFCLTKLNHYELERLAASGFNSLVLRFEQAEQTWLDHCKHLGFSIFLETALFVGKQHWETYQDARPLERSGKALEAINWYYGVCPNQPELRSKKLQEIKKALELENLSGLFLDFIRYPCHWEEVRSANLSEYCFCPNCLKSYQAWGGKEPEGESWTRWKCEQITQFVVEVRKLISTYNPHLNLGIFTVPWQENEFGGALRTILGQDRLELAKVVDSFAAMTYHALSAQYPPWIKLITQAIAHQTHKPVVPVVQAMNAPYRLSVIEFRQSLELALSCSTQIMVFHAEALLAENEKLQACHKVFEQAW